MDTAGHSKTVLIVDDSDVTREVLKRIVARMGHTVLEAENGDIAISILSETSPACVISDVCMPVKDGFAVLEHTLNCQRRIPVILTSSIPFDQEALYRRGVKGFIPKPFRIEEVRELVNRVINEHPLPERRKHPRFNMNLPISINGDAGSVQRGLSVNISRGGIKFVLGFAENPLPDNFSMDVHISGANLWIEKVMKIWEWNEGDNCLSAGGRFAQISDEADAWLREILFYDTLVHSK